MAELRSRIVAGGPVRLIHTEERCEMESLVLTNVQKKQIEAKFGVGRQTIWTNSKCHDRQIRSDNRMVRENVEPMYVAAYGAKARSGMRQILEGFDL